MENISGDQVRRLMVRKHKHVSKAFGRRHRCQVAAHAVHNTGGKVSCAFYPALVPPEYGI